jgi:hypothetical protein
MRQFTQQKLNQIAKQARDRQRKRDASIIAIKDARIQAMITQYRMLERELEQGRPAMQLAEAIRIQLADARRELIEARSTIERQQNEIKYYQDYVGDGIPHH